MNIWCPACERRLRFLVDPREQLHAQRWARDRRLRVIGHAHSHPAGPAALSARDLHWTIGPTLAMVWAGRMTAAQGLRAWWLSSPRQDDRSPLAKPVELVL